VTVATTERTAARISIKIRVDTVILECPWGTRLDYTPGMPDAKTQRSNCRFQVQQTQDGKAVVIVQLLHDTIPALNKTVVGFDLLGGIRLDQAGKLVDLLNEYVLDVFVTATEKGATA